MTVRARIALLYGTLFLSGGLVLVMAVYLLLRADLTNQLSAAVTRVLPAGTPTPDMVPGRPVQPGTTIEIAQVSRDTVLSKLLLVSLPALALLVALAGAVAWWVSGRVLRPVHRMSETARRLSSNNLHERIALDGPPDELKALADTFDGMLGRLETAFESQRRFIANASHELRTPLAIQRTAVQIGLSDVESPHLVAVREQLLAVNRRTEQLIDGLLVLARSDRGIRERQPVALHDIVEHELIQHTARTTARDLTVHSRLDDCHVLGDPVLLPQLVRNLVRNAVEHNVEHGEIHVRTTRTGQLRISNTGPVVARDTLSELFEPFNRGTERTAKGTGSGLGLSIIHSIAQAHEATLTAQARDDGGLDIKVGLPPADPPAT
jgi:signal transduction histidine kinase